MADYIPREAAIDAIEGINWYKYNDEGRLVQGGTSHDKMFLPYKAVEGSLKAIPAADVRPVVFCRDCKHWDIDWVPNYAKENEHVCPIVALTTRYDWFCADGEKREES